MLDLIKKIKLSSPHNVHLKSIFQNLVIYVYPLIIFFTFILCLFHFKITFAGSYLCANFLPPLLLLFFGIILIIGFFHLLTFFNVKHSIKIITILSSVLFLTQLFFIYNYYFYTDWDAAELIKFSDSLVHNKEINDYKWYFSRYPNNLFLAFIFSSIRLICHVLGVHAHEYFAILTFQCLLCTLTGFILFQTLATLFDNIYVPFLGYIVYVFFIGLSPWISIPYSDSMALIFPSLIIYIYICREKIPHNISWSLIGLCSYIGYKIKPQVFIVFIAVILVEIFNTDFIKHISNYILAGLGIISGVIIVHLCISTLPLSLDKNMAFGLPHFFMMGLNPVDMGIFSASDVDFSASFFTCHERNVANLYEALNRLKEMGGFGLLKLFVRKTLTNYYNGTFAWAAEGTFFSEIFNQKNTPICDFLRSLYYTRDYASIGKYYILWSNFEQMLWITILFFNVFSYSAPKNNAIRVIMLSLLGLTIFELIFEARARYLFIFSPLFIVLALYGFNFIYLRLLSKKDNI